MVAPTQIRIPRARLLLETVAGTGTMLDLGRVEDASFAVQSEPTITHDFDPTTCTRYESDRDYLDLAGVLTAQTVDGSAANIARHLLSTVQPVSAGVGKTFTSSPTVQDGDLLMLGWAPAGGLVDGAFVPSPFTTAEDSGTPTSLVEGTHYEWYDPRGGIVKVLDMTGLTAPLIFTGDSRATERAVLGDAIGAIHRLALLGVNQRGQCTGERLEIWRAVVQPDTAVTLSQALSNMEPTVLDLSIDALADPSRAGDPLLGQLGYWEQG